MPASVSWSFISIILSTHQVIVKPSSVCLKSFHSLAICLRLELYLLRVKTSKHTWNVLRCQTRWEDLNSDTLIIGQIEPFSFQYRTEHVEN